MSIQELLEPFAHFGVRLGLEAIQALLSNLGNPQEQVPVIHVAGSNGKGSVCAYLSSILMESGFRVGRYTSPHLIDWTERICLNGEPISTSELEALLQRITVVARSQSPTPTQFEIMTAAAWLYFARHQVDIAVIEVGLGGRLDATNVCETPLVSVITSISREHWRVLGSTLAEIASEKAGILKPGCPAVIGQLPPEANTVIFRRAAELGCPTVYPLPAKDLGNGWVEYQGIEEYEVESASSDDLDDSEDLDEDDFDEADFDADDLEADDLDEEDVDEFVLLHVLTSIQYQLPLKGAIQRQNSALAIAAIQILRESGWEISDEAIVEGIAKTRWPGRMQWFSWSDRQILIDGAHNPASAEVLRQYVDSLIAQPETHVDPSVHWVMGMLSTKDHADIFTALLRPGDSLYLVPVPDHSSADPEKLAHLAQEICPNLSHCSIHPDVISGLQATPQQDKLVVLCGSLYLIGHFFKLNQS